MDFQMNFNQVILTFIKERENEAVKEMLQRTTLLYHAVDASGATLLHYSAGLGNENITQFLLEKGCNANTQDSMGNSPLMNAVKNNNKAVVEILLAGGADISLLNHEDKSALHMLNYCGNRELYFSMCKLCLREFRKRCSSSQEAAEKLIDAGIELYLAAFSLDSKIMEYMLERGSPVDSTHPACKSTAIHVAVRFDDLDSVRVLLKYGANAEALDAENANPLRYVYSKNVDLEHNSNKIEILKILLSLGISLTSCYSKGRFNISSTLMYGNREAVRVALQSKLDFAARDKEQERTVVYYLTINPNPGVVEELEHLEESQIRTIIKYDVNAVDKDRVNNVLIAAAIVGNVDMLRFLLSRGAKLFDRMLIASFHGYDKFTPHSQMQYDQCVELLLQHNADPQYVIRLRGEMSTVFDMPMKTNYFNRMKPIVAHLSLVEKLGESITELISRKLNSDSTLNEYFNECRQLIRQRILGSITLFTLLTCNRTTMDRYLNNARLLQEIQHFNRRHNMEFAHSYLYSTWKKRLLEVQEYKKIKHQVFGALCRIIGDYINQNQLILENIIDYLDNRSIRQLTRL